MEHIVLLLAVVCGGFMAANGWSVYIAGKKMQRTPISKVDSAALGYVQFSGTPHEFRSTISPISKTRCAWWRVNVFKKTGKLSTVIKTADSPNPFLLQDETGSILIEPRNALLDIDGHWFPMDSANFDVLKNIFADDTVFAKLMDWYSVRVQEVCLIPAMRLLIVGELTPQKMATYETRVVKGNMDVPLIISERSQDALLASAGGVVLWTLVSGLLLIGSGIYGLLARGISESSAPFLFVGIFIAAFVSAAQYFPVSDNAFLLWRDSKAATRFWMGAGLLVLFTLSLMMR